MTITNHTLTGIVLSHYIHNPFVLAPAAFASHLVMDSLPHFGHPKWPFSSRGWLRQATVDNIIALGLFAAALVQSPHHWGLTLIGVFFATLPDLLFIPELLFGKPPLPTFRRFHARVQSSHTVPGIAVELLWAAGMSALLVASR
jgi:hypothetical protein